MFHSDMAAERQTVHILQVISEQKTFKQGTRPPRGMKRVMARIGFYPNSKKPFTRFVDTPDGIIGYLKNPT